MNKLKKILGMLGNVQRATIQRTLYCIFVDTILTAFVESVEQLSIHKIMVVSAPSIAKHWANMAQYLSTLRTVPVSI